MNFGYLRKDAPRIIRILHRVRRRGLILFSDISRSAGWYLFGGRRYFQEHYQAVRDRHQWCFIVGCNNSGTSLLQKVLEASGEVSTLPYEGQVYTRVLVRAMRRGYERVYTEYADALRMDATASLEHLPRLIYDWTRDLERPVRRIILEKTPHNVLRMLWLQNAFPGCKFICLVRNGYAVSEGIMRKGNKSAARAARHWSRVHEEMLAQLAGIDNQLVVRYEDLCEKPDEISDKMAGFLGMDRMKLRAALHSTRYISDMEDANSLNVMNMNYKSLQRLSSEELRTITEQAGAMLDKFGYQRQSTGT